MRRRREEISDVATLNAQSSETEGDREVIRPRTVKCSSRNVVAGRAGSWRVVVKLLLLSGSGNTGGCVTCVCLVGG